MASTRLQLGLRVKALRREKTGLSQERFGDAIEVSRSHMGLIERGLTNPTLETIVKIARGLDVSMAKLFEPFEGKPEWPPFPSRTNRKPK
jgi:transcriptional regulator with XRE-family HTH domain